MQGYGEIYNPTTPGTLEHFLANDGADEFGSVLDGQGDFMVRDDVWVRFKREEENTTKTGSLTAGFGVFDDFIGPELGFGWQLGDYFDEQVLIIKTAWGGRNLAVDFRPPSSGGTTGPYYQQILDDVDEALDNLSNDFPDYNNELVEIVGFAWHQGWNDGEEMAYLQEYETNMIHFVNDIRNDLNAPDMKFVIGNSGQGGSALIEDDLWVFNLQTILVPAQENAANHDGYEGVGLADTRPFYRPADISPSDAIYHWNDSGESYMLIGDDMGKVMIGLLDASQPSSVSYAVEPTHPISILPNYVKDAFLLRGMDGKQNINIINVNGVVVQSLVSDKAEVRIDISGLNPGMYFVEVRNPDNGSLSIKRLVKH